MSIRSFFSDSFPEQTFGRITGTFNISQFPDVPGVLARFKAQAANTSPFWLGKLINTGTSFPLPYQISAGYDTEWIPLVLDDKLDAQGNLNVFWQNGASGSCYLDYWVLR